MSTADFDFSELNALVADLTRVPKTASRNVEKAIEVTARNVKDDWRKKASRTRLGPYAADVDYDINVSPGEIAAEVGPTPGDAGSLGIMEDAPGGVKSAPQHAGRDALEANEADFIHGIELAIGDALADEIGA